MWLTVKEVSDITKIKKSTLYLWVSQEVIPHYRLGRLVRFKLNEVEKWLDKFKKEPDSRRERLERQSRKVVIPDVEEIIRKAIDEAKTHKV